VLATTFYPLAYSLTTAFRDWDLTRSRRPEGWVGFDNFIPCLHGIALPQFALGDDDLRRLQRDR
jgi:ABC-type sugar transport system permease subunit